MKRPPEKLPDPWLFDSEALLREPDRCRELVLRKASISGRRPFPALPDSTEPFATTGRTSPG
jgi:hypothetical protein